MSKGREHPFSGTKNTRYIPTDIDWSHDDEHNADFTVKLHSYQQY